MTSSFALGATVPFSCNTRNSSGAVDADSLPTYEVYDLDGADTPILSGSLAKRNDTSTTGYYSGSVVASAGAGFAAGKLYEVRITATVGGVSESTSRYFQISAVVTAGSVSDKSGYSLSAAGVTVVQTGLSTLTAQQVWEYAQRTLSAFGFGVTVSSNQDKTGYALSNDGVTAVQAGLSTLTAQGVWEYGTRTLSSFGNLVSDTVAAVWGAGSRTLTAFGFGVTVTTNNDKSGYALSSDGASAVQSGLSTLTAQQVWEYGTRTLTGFGSLLAGLGAAVWSYTGAGGRKLTATAEEISAAMEGAELVIRRGDLYEHTLTDLVVPETRTRLYLTVKASKSHTDAQAILQFEETDGLLRLNGAQAADVEWGSITYDQEEAALRIRLAGAAAAALSEVASLYYDVQYLDADGEPHTVTESTARVTADVTRATS